MPLSTPARRQQALWEIDRLIGEYKDWVAAVTLPQYTTQVESISSEVLICADRLRKSLENLVVAGSAGAVYSHCTRIEKQIAWLWRAWFYFKEKFDQRGSDGFGDTLKAADEVIWSSYRPFFTQGLQERVPEPAPLPYIEMEFSPIALRRDQHSVIGGKQDNYELLAEAFMQLPTSILKLPVSCVGNPWALALIGHETGHFVQLCSAETLHPSLTQQFPRANIHGGVRRERPSVEPYAPQEYDADERSPARADVMPRYSRPKAHVRSGEVEMCDPSLQDELEMTLIEGNKEVQTFAAQRPTETFAE